MKRRPDVVLFSVVIALVAIGIVTVYSASYPIAARYARVHDAATASPGATDVDSDAADEAPVPAALQQTFMRRQMVWAALGLLCLIVALNMPLARLRSPGVVGAVLLMAFVLLALAYVPGVGSAQGREARRWIHVGHWLTLQPSEFAKFAMCLFLAYALSSLRERINDWRYLREVLAVLCLMLGLVVMEPHLGGTLVMAATAACVFAAAGLRRRWFGYAAVAAVLLVAVSITFQPYQRLRLVAWLDPVKYADSIGYHAVHCGTALSRGGWVGRGLGRSIEKFSYLPECHTDSILAVLGEEHGFIGAFTVLALFLTLAIRGMYIATAQERRFDCYLAVGLTAGIFLQAMLNFGVTSGLLPQTGVGMPFLTYGGSSLVFCMAAVGVLLNLSCNRPAADRPSASRVKAGEGVRGS